MPLRAIHAVVVTGGGQATPWPLLSLRSLVLIAAFVCGGLPVARVQAACRIETEAVEALRPSPYGPLIAALVNGRSEDFVLDTGAARSVLDEAAMARLHLPLDQWASMTMGGIGGAERHRVADLQSFSIGGARLRRRSIANDMSVAVVPSLPSSASPSPIAGLLGGDYLAFHDLELDPVAHTATLHAVNECRGRFLPWASPYEALAATRPNLNWLVVPVLLDGRRLQALVDTGAASSFITPRGERQFGVSGTRPGDLTAVRGIGPTSLRVHARLFQSMTVGSETLRAVSLLVVPYVFPGFDMVLGADWLLPHHVWLSYQTGQMFFVAASVPTIGNTSQ